MRRLGPAALVAVLAVSASASAETPKDAAADSVTATVLETEKLDQKTLDAAETAFFEGLVHYRGKRFEEAAQAFQKAWTLSRHRDMLFNVGQAREKLGDKVGAVEWYRAYLGTQPADETAVIHRVKQLGGESMIAKAETPKANVRSVDTRVERVEEGAGPWPWVAVGVATAATVGGAVVGLAALDEADAARSAALRADAVKYKDAAESGALTADLLFGVGALSAAAAVYLWLRADSLAAPAAEVELGATPTGGWLGVTGRF